jgi:hypothetical protein
MAANRILRSAVLMLLKAPFFAVYGAYALAAGYLRGMGRLGERVRFLRLSLPCPSCEERNPIDGRWKCRSCSAIYHGAVFYCGFCGAGASFFSCRRCGISIALGRPS